MIPFLNKDCNVYERCNGDKENRSSPMLTTGGPSSQMNREQQLRRLAQIQEAKKRLLYSSRPTGHSGEKSKACGVSKVTIKNQSPTNSFVLKQKGSNKVDPGAPHKKSNYNVLDKLKDVIRIGKNSHSEGEENEQLIPPNEV